MQTLKNKRILITCGPTWIPIDDTRIISNKSTGRLGQIIAKDLARSGASITVLEGPVANSLKERHIRTHKFHYYDEILSLMTKELKKKYHVIIHAAAVSDYKLKKPFERKLSSKHKLLTLDLTRTKKIINLIKDLNPKAMLVGFKLRSHMTKDIAVEKSKILFEKAKCDLVLANSSSDHHYNAYIIDRERNFLAHEMTREKISKALVRVLRGALK